MYPTQGLSTNLNSKVRVFSGAHLSPTLPELRFKSSVFIWGNVVVVMEMGAWKVYW